MDSRPVRELPFVAMGSTSWTILKKKKFLQIKLRQIADRIFNPPMQGLGGLLERAYGDLDRIGNSDIATIGAPPEIFSQRCLASHTTTLLYRPCQHPSWEAENVIGATSRHWQTENMIENLGVWQRVRNYEFRGGGQITPVKASGGPQKAKGTHIHNYTSDSRARNSSLLFINFNKLFRYFGPALQGISGHWVMRPQGLQEL